MNCKVCGNAVSGIEKTCSLCGNDLEAQRREAADDVRESASSGSFYAPPLTLSSLTQEKDEAINRILYDSDGMSAKERLEERRKKRVSERSGVGAGISSLFSQERKETPPPEPEPEPLAFGRPPSAPVPASPVPASADQERPRRDFSSEFVFGEKPKPEFRAPAPAPAQQSFAVPSTPEVFAVPQTPDHDSAPQNDPYFALTSSDEEQAKFDVDKKNEEFQELLDKEFERLKHYSSGQPEMVRSQLEPEESLPEPAAEADSRSYIQGRIDEYLRRSDHDMAIAVREQNEPLHVFEPAPAVSEAIVVPGAPVPAAQGTPDASYRDPGFAAVRTPMPEEGFSFDGNDYGHGFSHGEKPVSDFEIDKQVFDLQDATFDPEAERLHVGVPDQEFAATEPPAATEPFPSVSYADFEQYDFAKAEADIADEFVFQPVADIPPVIEQPSAPVATVPAPVVQEPPEDAIQPAQPPVAETPTPWGQAPNQAPTRENVAAFLDRPIDFPFDEPPVSATPVSDTAPTFDFEPIESAAELAAPAAETPPAPEAPPVPAFESGIPPAHVPETQAPAPDVSASEAPHEEATLELLGMIDERPAAEAAASSATAAAFAAPFSLDIFDNAPVEQAVEPSAQAPAEAPAEGPLAGENIARPKSEDTSDWFATPGLPPLTFDLPEPGPSVSDKFPALDSPADAPDFVDLMTERERDGSVNYMEETEIAAPYADDQDGPPAFYKEYTQGYSAAKIEAAYAEAAGAAPFVPAPVPASAPQAEVLPEFLTAYDNEQLGKDGAEQTKPEDPVKKSAQVSANQKKSSSSAKQTDAKRTALSVIITILIVILVIVVACIVVLKLMPDSVGAYYIQDFVGMIQEKLGIGSSGA